MARIRQYPPDNGNVISPEQVAEFNRRFDAQRYKLPDHFTPVPHGFDKRLKDDELNPIVWNSIREHDAIRFLLSKPTDLTA